MINKVWPESIISFKDNERERYFGQNLTFQSVVVEINISKRCCDLDNKVKFTKI